MPNYKEELEKRKAAKQAAAAHEAAQRQEAVATTANRAKELVKHIEASGAPDLGVTLRLEGARLELRHQQRRARTGRSDAPV